jgi:hypothetical protein
MEIWIMGWRAAFHWCGFGALICLCNDMHYPGDRCFLLLFWRKVGITAWVSSSSWTLQRDNRSEDIKATS